MCNYMQEKRYVSFIFYVLFLFCCLACFDLLVVDVIFLFLVNIANDDETTDYNQSPVAYAQSKKKRK